MGLNRIYTRTGDRGTTAIHGGDRVAKTDQRIEANGTLDELNTTIGIVRSYLDLASTLQAPLKEIQLSLMSIMSIVATLSIKRDINPNKLPEDIVAHIEALIDEFNSRCSRSEYFILPGGSQASAFMHQARVAARRAERELWRLNDEDPVPEQILIYINRLSDLFFVMARYELEQSQIDEERWNEFAYKKKK